MGGQRKRSGSHVVVLTTRHRDTLVTVMLKILMIPLRLKSTYTDFACALEASVLRTSRRQHRSLWSEESCFWIRKSVHREDGRLARSQTAAHILLGHLIEANSLCLRKRNRTGSGSAFRSRLSYFISARLGLSLFRWTTFVVARWPHAAFSFVCVGFERAVKQVSECKDGFVSTGQSLFASALVLVCLKRFFFSCYRFVLVTPWVKAHTEELW